MSGSAAQPSLPHDELEAAYGGCRLCYGKGYATTISYSTGSHYSKQDPVIRCCTCGRGEQLQALIQAQRQEAVREALQKLLDETSWSVERAYYCFDCNTFTHPDSYKNPSGRLGIPYICSNCEKGKVIHASMVGHEAIKRLLQTYLEGEKP